MRYASVKWPDRINIPNEWFVMLFFQKQADRLVQGFCRYAGPARRQQYLTRIRKELKAYETTGNAEHLYNIANYCHLEAHSPQHPDFHEDNTVDSVTRE